MSSRISFACAAAALLASSAAPPRARAQEVPRRGEELISAAQARKDVTWLVDPARTGRGVGTPGNAAAAMWVAARMRMLELAGGGDGTGSTRFDQVFQAPVGVRLGGANALRLAGRDVALGAWQPFTFSDDGAAEAELVWAGYGITAPALGYDDYADLDVKGKIVVVAAHFPRESDRASPFRDPQALQYGEWRYKAMNARDHGAAAILAVRDDWNHKGADDVPPPRGAASRAGVVAARVSLAALAQADGKPRSRALGVAARVEVHVEQERATTANVISLVRGSDPDAGCVVVGAHYDHLGYGGDTSLAPDRHDVHPGADDNASGVAALLEVAWAMESTPQPRRTIVFAAFTGEELGLLGSSYFVKHPPAGCTPERTQLMVNLDMVGRPRDGKLYVQGADTAEGERARIEKLAAAGPPVKLKLAFGGGGYGPSDHTSFYARGVPVVFLFDGGNADYHRPSDTADKIDVVAIAEAARLAYRVALAAADAPERYAVVREPPPPGSAAPGEPREGRAAGYGAYLGSIPDFGEGGEPGARVAAVKPGSPAEKAGLTGGDLLVEVGGTPVKSLQDLTYALRAHRPGDVVEVVWKRGGETRRAKVALEERK
jgi:aminopeptidase YwaD